MKKCILGITAAVLVLTAVGCRRSEDLTVVLDWSVNTNHTGLYAAVELGYFEEEGIKVNIEFPPETGSVSIVASGSADMGFSYQEEVTLSRAADIPVIAVAAVLQHNTSGFASRKSVGIETPADFEGKRYGGWGSPMEEAILKAVMSHHGADYSTLEIVSIGTMDFLMATEEEIDVVWIFEGWSGIAAELQGVDISYIPLKDETYLPDYYTPVLVAGEKFLTDKPEAARSFLKALRRGYEYASANPEEAAEMLLKHAPELDEELVRISQRYLADKYTADAPAWGVMDPAVWQEYARWMNGEGLLEPMIDPDKAFTNEYLPR